MAGQEHGEALAVLWGLQAFAIRYVEIREAPIASQPGRRIKVIGLEDTRSSHICSECGKRHLLGLRRDQAALGDGLIQRGLGQSKLSLSDSHVSGPGHNGQ